METVLTFASINSTETVSNLELNLNLNDNEELGNLYLLFWDGFALPIVGLLGIIGNVLSILVLSRKSMRNSAINIVLIGLTAADLCFVISMIIWMSVGHQFGKWVLNNEAWIGWSNAICHPISHTGWYTN